MHWEPCSTMVITGFKEWLIHQTSMKMEDVEKEIFWKQGNHIRYEYSHPAS